MRKTKIIILPLIMICMLGGLCQAQTTAVVEGMDGSPFDARLLVGSLRTDNFRASDLEYDDIKGSPYLEKEYLTGYVTLIDHKKTSDIKLQFDIYSYEFFYIDEKGQELVIDLKLIREIYMRGEKEDYKFKRVNPRQPNRFYEVLYEDEGMHIYKEHEVNFFEGKDQGIAKIEPRFSNDENYFVYIKGEEPRSIKLKKKNVLKLFSKEKKSEIETFIKANKIKLKKRQDFKKVFDKLMSS